MSTFTYRAVDAIPSEEIGVKTLMTQASIKATTRALDLGVLIIGPFEWWIDGAQLVGLAPARWLADLQLSGAPQVDVDPEAVRRAVGDIRHGRRVDLELNDDEKAGAIRDAVAAGAQPSNAYALLGLSCAKARTLCPDLFAA